MTKKAAQATPNQLLRRARLERGWTQKEVADRIGLPWTSMSHAGNGEQLGQAPTMCRSSANCSAKAPANWACCRLS